MSVVSGVSKAFAATGWRVGWLVGAPALVATASKLQEATIGCGVPFAQAGAKEALLSVHRHDVASMTQEYERRREYMSMGKERLRRDS